MDMLIHPPFSKDTLRIPSIFNSSEQIKHKFYSPFLKSEFGEIKPEDYKTIVRIKGIIEGKVATDPNRHIIDVLEKIKDEDEVRKLLGMVHKSIDGDKENASLKKLRECLAYKALILLVRDWPKKELHCHVSDSLDDEFGLKQLKDKPEKKKEILGKPGQIEKNIKENPCGRKLKDVWISDIDDFVLAVRHVVKQYFEDGVTMVELRFNPKKAFMKNSDMKTLLDRVLQAVSEEEKTANEFSGHTHKVRFMFSLNRGKYPAEIISVIEELCRIKENTAGLLNERMHGIDISGSEMNEWEFDNQGEMTDRGKKLLDALQKAHSVGFEIVSHLGHSSSVDKRYKKGGLLVEYKTLHQLKYIASYIVINGFSRIGHGSIIRPIDPKDSHKGEAEKQLAIVISELIKKDVIIERCPKGTPTTLQEIKDTPVYFWKDNEIKFVLGVDGLHRLLDGLDGSISLSQWVVMLLLAAPKDKGWTVEYLKNIVLDNSGKEVDKTILHTVDLQQHRISGEDI